MTYVVPHRRTQPQRRQKGGKGLSLYSSGNTVKLWNTYAQQMPFFSGVQSKDMRPYKFTQTLNLGSLYSTSVTLNTGAGRSFTSADITQFASFAAIFDQYRFDVIEVWLMPNSTTIGANEGAGLLYSAIDYDGVGVVNPATLAQRTNVAVSLHNSGHYHRFRPHVAVATFGGGSFASYKNEASDWLDVASTAINHYGLDACSEPTPIGIQTIDCLCRINISFRNVV